MKKGILVFGILISQVVFGQTVLLTQDFESGSLPAGWTRTQNTPSVGWEFGANLGSSYFSIPAHTNYAASNDDAHDDNSTNANLADVDRLITPILNLTSYAGQGILLEFDYLQPGNFGSSGSVEVSTNSGSTWNSLGNVGTSGLWTTASLNLSAYAGLNNIAFAFRHNDGGNWADGFAIDNVLLKVVPQYDAMAEAVTLNSYVATGNSNITGTIKNMGSATITTLVASYTIDGGLPVTETFSGLSVALGASADITFTVPANLTLGPHTVCIQTGNVNGNLDANASNNEICLVVEALSAIPTKKTVLERHTGSWCQFCPDGEVVMSQIDISQPNTICVAIHNSDAMAIADGTTIQNEYISGYPGGTVDRYPFNGVVEQNRGDWEALCMERNQEIVPLGVSILSQNWNSTTREISATVKVDFVGGMTGDLRFNLFVVEDSVVGTGSGYDQVNYYNTVAGHPYYQAGNPIVGFPHKKVVRAMLGGAWGTAGVIPTSVSSGNSYTNTYTYTLPAGYNENKITLVGLVQKYDANANDRIIYNAEEVTLWLGEVSVETVNDPFKQRVYPNPFDAFTRLEFELPSNTHVQAEVYDMLGGRVRTLVNGFMNQGQHSIVWYGDQEDGSHVANGEYIISFKVNGKAFQHKVLYLQH